jgi:hypothetical protein
MKYLILPIFFIFLLSGIYGQAIEKQYYVSENESLDSLKLQRVTALKVYSAEIFKLLHDDVSSTYDKNGYPLVDPNYNTLILWTGYKIECFQDSIVKQVNVFSDGVEGFYYGDVNMIDPGLSQAYQGVKELTYRRRPTAEGFLEYQLKILLNKAK